MLLKGGSDTLTEIDVFVTEKPVGALADVPTSAEDTVAVARAEIQDLHERLQRMRTEHIAELERARATARQETAAEHVRNEAAHLAALSSALIAARDIFVSELQVTSRALAVQLACAALQRLVETRRDDEDWLLRFVERRLAEIDAASVVAIVLPDARRAIADQLASPLGTTVVYDPALPADAARIDLTVGRIPIRIDEGLARVLAALDPQSDTHG